MRFALVGCGEQGLAYASALAELGLETAACADPHPTAAKKAARRCGAIIQSDFSRILSLRDINALVLCVPQAHRLALLRRAAARGLHVLCVAPLGPAPAPVRKALDAVRAANSTLYVAHDGRAAPEEVALQRQLDLAAAGRPGFIRIHRSLPAVPGAHALECLLPRDLDWLFRRFGATPRIFGQALQRRSLSHASLTLRFPSGPIVQWIGTLGAPARTRIEVCGTGGMLEYSSDDPVLEVAPAGKAAKRSSPIAHALPVRHLVHFIAAAESPAAQATCDHELAIVRGVEAALRSARSGAETSLA